MTIIDPQTNELNVDHWYKRVEVIRDSAAKAREVATSKLGDNSQNDIRVLVFKKYTSILATFMINIRFFDLYLYEGTWWLNNTNIRSQDDRRDLVLNQDVFLKVSIITISFGLIESGLRALMRGINPLAHNKSSADFHPIYNNLFSSRLSSTKKEYIDFLDFFSTLRNTVSHNNGVYFHKSDQSVVRKFRENEYQFEIGKAIDFANWEIVVQILEDSMKMLEEVVFDENIINITSKMVDPTV